MALGILLLFFALAIATVSDLKTRTIPDITHVILLLPGVAIIASGGSSVYRAAGFVLIGSMMLVISLIGTLGGGDVKMGACIGFALGLFPALTAIFIGCLAGTIAGLALGCFKKRIAIPLAPFMSAGCVAVLLLGCV